MTTTDDQTLIIQQSTQRAREIQLIADDALAFVFCLWSVNCEREKIE